MDIRKLMINDLNSFIQKFNPLINKHSDSLSKVFASFKTHGLQRIQQFKDPEYAKRVTPLLEKSTHPFELLALYVTDLKEALIKSDLKRVKLLSDDISYLQYFCDAEWASYAGDELVSLIKRLSSEDQLRLDGLQKMADAELFNILDGVSHLTVPEAIELFQTATKRQTGFEIFIVGCWGIENQQVPNYALDLIKQGHSVHLNLIDPNFTSQMPPALKEWTQDGGIFCHPKHTLMTASLHGLELAANQTLAEAINKSIADILSQKRHVILADHTGSAPCAILRYVHEKNSSVPLIQQCGYQEGWKNAFLFHKVVFTDDKKDAIVFKTLDDLRLPKNF